MVCGSLSSEVSSGSLPHPPSCPLPSCPYLCHCRSVSGHHRLSAAAGVISLIPIDLPVYCVCLHNYYRGLFHLTYLVCSSGRLPILWLLWRTPLKVYTLYMYVYMCTNSLCHQLAYVSMFDCSKCTICSFISRFPQSPSFFPSYTS